MGFSCLSTLDDATDLAGCVATGPVFLALILPVLLWTLMPPVVWFALFTIGTLLPLKALA